MKFKTVSWLLILILLLSMPALACNVFDSFGDDETTTSSEDDEEPAEEEEAAEEEAEDEEEADAAEEEAEEVEDTAAEEETVDQEAEEPVEEESDEGSAEDSDAAEEESADTSAALGSTVNIGELSAQDDLLFEDYRFVLDFSYTVDDESGEPVTQSVFVDALFNAEPPAFSMDFALEGVEGAEDFGSLSMAQIGETTYMTLPEMGCISSSSGEMDNPFAELTDQDQFLQDVGNADFVGEETINGVETLHYAFDEGSLEGEEMGDIRTMDGHVYIAKDEGYIVRFVMDGEGILEDFTDGADQEGTFHVQFDLMDVNSGQVVGIPAGCEADAEGEGGNGEYPMLDDAANVTSFSGILIYSTAVPFEEIISFYNDELAAAGWSYDENESFILEGSTAILVYRMENGDVLNVTVTEDTENAGSFLVSVTNTAE